SQAVFSIQRPGSTSVARSSRSNLLKALVARSRQATVADTSSRISRLERLGYQSRTPAIQPTSARLKFLRAKPCITTWNLAPASSRVKLQATRSSSVPPSSRGTRGPSWTSAGRWTSRTTSQWILTETLPMVIPPSSSSSCPVLTSTRSEEHTSELQSRENLVCRLLLEKKEQNNDYR